MSGDLLVQLRAELVFRPDSWLTSEVQAWYDSLYKESQDIDTYSNCDCSEDWTDELDFSSPQNFLNSLAIQVGKQAFKKLAKEAEKAL